MFAEILQRIDEGGADDADEHVDDDHARGGSSPPEVIPAAFPPSDLHRRWPADSLFIFF
jgi:hypothetical protein